MQGLIRHFLYELEHPAVYGASAARDTVSAHNMPEGGFLRVDFGQAPERRVHCIQLGIGNFQVREGHPGFCVQGFWDAADHGLYFMGQPMIILVSKKDYLGSDGLEQDLQGRGQTQVAARGLDQPDSGILAGIFLEDGRAVVCGAVVSDIKGKVLPGLAQYGVQLRNKVCLSVMHRQDNRHAQLV